MSYVVYLQSTATVEGNTFTVKSKDSDGRGGQRVYAASATGLTVVNIIYAFDA